MLRKIKNNRYLTDISAS